MCAGSTLRLHYWANGIPAGQNLLRAERAKEVDVATFLERVWRRHSNPWSVWTRILSYPLVYIPVWNRSWRQGAAAAAWFAANPVLFPEPKGDEPWADRKSTRLNSSHANISYAVFCL